MPGPVPELDPLLTDEALEELNRVWTIARIFSSTAHDVNNALQVISGSAELLEARADVDATTLRRAQAIRNQTARATEAIDRLLKYTRHTGTSPQVIDVASILDVAVAMRSFTLHRASITVDCSRSDDQPYRAVAEPRVMLQLLLTLLLLFEKSLAARAPARIVVTLDREPSGGVALSMAGEAAQGDTPDPGRDAAVPDPLAPVQLAALHRLVERQHATLALDADGVRLRIARITLPGS